MSKLSSRGYFRAPAVARGSQRPLQSRLQPEVDILVLTYRWNQWPRQGPKVNQFWRRSHVVRVKKIAAQRAAVPPIPRQAPSNRPTFLMWRQAVVRAAMTQALAAGAGIIPLLPLRPSDRASPSSRLPAPLLSCRSLWFTD